MVGGKITKASNWPSSKIRTALIAILIAFACFFGATLGLALTTPPDYIATFWPPNTVILAALLLTDRRRWWIWFLAMTPAYLIAASQVGLSPSRTLIFFVANCAEILFAALALKFVLGDRIRFDQIREMIMFLLWAVLLAPIVSAFIASLAAFSEAEVNYWLAWRVWFLGNALGHLTLTPVIILWISSGAGWIKQVPTNRLIEGLCLALSLFVVGFFSLGIEIGAAINLPVLLYTPLPVLLWAAIRFGPRGICSAVFVITLLAIWNAVSGRGPFIADTPADNVFSLQLFLFAIAVPTMLLGSLLSERILAGKALQESESKYRDLVETSDYLIWTMDARGVFTYINSAVKLAFERTEEEILGHPYTDFLNPEVPDQGLKIFRKFIAGEKVAPYEAGFISKSGQKVSFRLTVRAIYDDHGRIVATQGTGQNITKQRETEEALQESETKFQDLVETSQDLIWRVDEDSRFTYLNPAWETVLGYEREEMIGHQFTEFNDPQETQITLETFKEVLRGKVISDRKSSFFTKGGSKVTLMLKLKPVTDQNSLITGAQGTAIDVTEQLRAEIALQESRSKEKQALMRLNDAIESLPGSFAIYDADNRFVLGNRNTLKMFPDHASILTPGTSYEEVINVSIDLGLIPFESENREEYIRERLRQFRDSPEFYEQKWADGRWFAVYHRPTSDGGIVTIRLDITEQKQVEEQLRQSQKMQALGTLAGGIAHDFNNILAPILGYSELLMENPGIRGEERSFVGSIFESAQRAKDLVSQILLFSRRSQAEKKIEDLSLMLPGLVQLITSTLPATIVVTEEISAESACAFCDSSQIHQVLVNLCVNAGQAIVGAGEIKITLEIIELDNFKCIYGNLLSGKHIRIRVMDNGVGIDEETFEHIFEPFYTTKAVGTGTGLGLSTVFGIVQDHGGGIVVSSGAGEGTAFEIFLPLVEGSIENRSETPEQTHKSGTEHILFVDDEDAIRSLAKITLEQLGYTVTVDSDGQRALDIFAANPSHFDMVITDQTMPNMTGDQLALEVLKLRPEIPIIACTGHSTILTPEKSKAIGICKFLYKPYRPSDLSRVVREVLDNTTTATG